MNKKDIQRNEYLRIRMSKEEKELFEEYAKELGLVPTKLARNILLEQACEKCFFRTKFEKGVLKAYKTYVNTTNDKEAIERFKKHDMWYEAKTDKDKEKIEEEIDKLV